VQKLTEATNELRRRFEVMDVSPATVTALVTGTAPAAATSSSEAKKENNNKADDAKKKETPTVTVRIDVRESGHALKAKLLEELNVATPFVSRYRVYLPSGAPLKLFRSLAGQGFAMDAVASVEFRYS
jgi:hypothetical protein